MAFVGKQAEVLNILLEDLLEGHAVSETKLKEVLGHTPIQVHILHKTGCKHALVPPAPHGCDNSVTTMCVAT